jgi:Ca2+/Na+ antiporter
MQKVIKIWAYNICTLYKYWITYPNITNRVKQSNQTYPKKSETSKGDAEFVGLEFVGLNIVCIMSVKIVVNTIISLNAKNA